MAKRTQKAGATARFGPRYGVSVRRRAGSAMAKKSRWYTCPKCHYVKVRRRKQLEFGNARSVTIHSPEEFGSPTLGPVMPTEELLEGRWKAPLPLT